MQALLDINHGEDSLEHDGDGRWPFHSFFEQLILEMFDPGKLFNFPLFLLLSFFFFFFFGGGGGGVMRVFEV
jgi:hypothetical protein